MPGKARAIPEVNKAVNTGVVHASDQAVARGVFPDTKSASEALKNLSKSITKDGFPPGTKPDPLRADSVLVPIGEGFASYEVKSNGTAILRTVIK